MFNFLKLKKNILCNGFLFCSLFVNFAYAYDSSNLYELRIPLQSSTIFFDPSGVQDSQSLFVSRQINCQLVRNQGYSFELEAAESIKYLTPKKILLTLKDNVKFNDGTKVTSEDVIASYNYIKNSRHIFQNLFNWVDNIDIVDDHTIIFNLNKEAPQFLKVLSSTTYPIFKKKFLEEAQKNHSLWKSPLSCGGYKVSQFNENQIKLSPIEKGIPITFILTKTNQINSSDIDKYDIVSINVIGTSKDLENFNALRIYDPLQFFVGLNSKSKFWETKNQRCKFLNDLNVEDILHSYGEDAIIANDYFPKGTLGFSSSGQFFKKTREIAKISPQLNKKGQAEKFCISYLTVSIQEKYKDNYLQMFQHIYPEAALKPLQSTQNFGKDFVDSNCDAFLFAWKSSYFDGYEYLTILEDNNIDFSRIHDKHLSQSILRSQEILNPSLRSKNYMEIINNIANSCIIRPLITIPEKKIYVRKNLSTPGIGLVPTHLYYLGNVKVIYEH